MNRLIGFLVFLIAYGSFFPFEFSPPADVFSELKKALNFNVFATGIPDMVANIALFVPFGLAWSSQNNRQRGKALLYFITITFAIAWLIQLGQVWLGKRIPYGGDAIFNTLGACMGFYLRAHVLDKAFSSSHLTRFPKLDKAVIIGLVLLSLSPFVPTIDVSTVINNAKRLFFFSTFNLIPALAMASYVYVVLHLVQKQCSQRVYYLFLPIIALVFTLGPVFILQSGVSVNSLIGTALGIASMVVFNHVLKFKADYSILSKLFLAFIVLDGLAAFTSSPSWRSFNLIPFAPALGNNTLINLFSFVESASVYFAYLYLAYKANYKLEHASKTLFLWVLGIEAFQIGLEGVTPDATEAFLAIAMASVSARWLYREPISTLIEPYTQSVSFKRGVLFCVAAVLAQAAFFSLPNLPYNLQELYRHTNLVSYLAVAISMLVFAHGLSNIAIRHATGRYSSFQLTLHCAWSLMLTLLALRIGISKESIADINGSSNITYQLVGQQVLGQFGADMVNVFGQNKVHNLSQIIEPFVRFAALLGPLAIALTVSLSLVYSARFGKARPYSITSLVFSLLPALFMCKVVTFDFSSTDNLNELIARPNALGISGGLYLYALIALLSASVALLYKGFYSKGMSSKLLGSVSLLLSIPLSWWLLNAGLVDNFTKYNHTFSGVDFLIGGSRSALLSDWILFVRWAVFYLVSVFGLVSLFGIVSVSPTPTPTPALKPTSIQKDKQTPKQVVVPNKHAAISSGPATQTTPQHIAQNRKMQSSLLAYCVLGGIVLVAGVLVMRFGFSLGEEKTVQYAWSNQPANMLFDHHAHTTYSDGKYSVAELVTLASENGCDAITVSDHADVKRMHSKKRLQEIQQARQISKAPLVLAGVELNPPSYQGREHVNLLLSPAVESSFLAAFNQKMLSGQLSQSDEVLFNSINNLIAEPSNAALIYNHPSRKDANASENQRDYVQWLTNNPLLIGLSGALGHQAAENKGSYNELIKTVHGWDPVVANIGGTVDRLLEAGIDAYVAIASSDFHSDNIDYPPCAFSAIHVIAPEKSYSGLFQALHSGTFWASHGRFLNQYHLTTDVNKGAFSPGETAVADKGEFALVTLKFERSRRFFDYPLNAELITNCVSGKVSALKPITLAPFENESSVIVPINHVGTDGASCYLRSRVFIENPDGARFYAYSNHVRVRLQ